MGKERLNALTMMNIENEMILVILVILTNLF